jgi:cell division protein FtsN
MSRRNRSSRNSEPAPGWVWMLFGLGLGLVVAIGVYLRSGREAPSAAPPDAAPTTASAPVRTRETESAQPPSATPNRFDFYEILPQIEVGVREPQDSEAPRERSRPVEKPGSFLLQAGSFAAAADADRLKASLGLLGFESHVQRVTIGSTVFNRVRIGPIDDLAAAERTQRRLRDAGIDTLLMRVPQ